MNIFEELKPQIEAFQYARDRVVSKASLPSTHGGMNCGEPPFAVDDGTNYYAVIDVDGQVKPLPFGYQIASDDMDTDGVDVIISTPMALDGSGMGMARYVPLVEDFEIPGERAFCLESAEDSDAWEALGKMVDALQQTVNEKALIYFNQRIANTISRLYEGFDGFDSVDQAIAALFLQPSALPGILRRSYHDAFEGLEDELNDEQEGEE